MAMEKSCKKLVNIEYYYLSENGRGGKNVCSSSGGWDGGKQKRELLANEKFQFGRMKKFLRWTIKMDVQQYECT